MEENISRTAGATEAEGITPRGALRPDREAWADPGPEDDPLRPGRVISGMGPAGLPSNIAPPVGGNFIRAAFPSPPVRGRL